MLSSSLAVEHTFERIQFQADAGRNISRVTWASSINPVGDCLGILGILFEPLATRMRNHADGLFNHQARLRHGKVDTAAGHFSSDSQVVAIGIKTEQ